ncbi:MAG: zinc ribbon domain-containing protein [Promethearchaeota archaeon]
MIAIARTKREFRLSCLGLLIVGSVGFLLYFIFGPNAFQNPIIMGFYILFFLITLCWLFGYIPEILRYIKRKKIYIDDASRAAKTYVKPTVHLEEIQTETLNNKIACPHCGAPQEKDTNFCTKCGQEIITKVDRSS